MEKINYTAVLLDAFERDLRQRQSTGDSDVFFDGKSGVAKARDKVSGDQSAQDGVPGALLKHVVETIFGESRKGSLTWRGFRMSAQPIRDGEHLVDALAVRLDTKSI